jgi:septal ring factor EnvC (AmiA/AmiB activator)
VAVAAAVAVAAGGLGAAVQDPQPPGRADAAAQRTAERLKALQRESDALAARERTLLVELRALEVKRQQALEQLKKVDADLSATRAALALAEGRADALARQADLQAPDVEARLVNLYKMGRAGYWRLLLNVEDLHGLARAYRAASALQAIDRARVNEHWTTLEGLAKERRTLQAREKDLAELQRAAAAARTDLEGAVAARSRLIASIDERRDLNARLIGELETAQARLQASIAQLGAGKAVAPALPLRAFQGALPWPLQGAVTQPFGRQPNSRFGTAIVRNGIVIAAGTGQPVRSVHEGTVAFSDVFEGYGNLVIVDHAARSYSLYGYLDTIAAERGQRVEAGTVVGTSGTGPAGNPSLYFELRVDGTAVDPLQWLRN